MKSGFTLPKIYPLTSIELSGLSHADQVHLLSLGGATLIQLREKQLPPAQFFEHAKTAVEAAEKSGVRVIINDRADIALAVGAHGVHLGQDDLSPDAARKLLGDNALIGYSTHNVEQARQALTQPIDYIAIGPIFETSTKSDTFPTLGLNGLRAVRDAVGNAQLVAIGGISHTNAHKVIEAGANSVAVISALLADPAQIPNVTRTLIHLCQT